MHSHYCFYSWCCCAPALLLCTPITAMHFSCSCAFLLHVSSLLCSCCCCTLAAVHLLPLCTHCCDALIAAMHSLLRCTLCCDALFAAVHSLLLCAQICRALVLQCTQFAYVHSYCLYALILLRCTVLALLLLDVMCSLVLPMYLFCCHVHRPYVHSDCTRAPFLGTYACTYTEISSVDALCLCVHMPMHRGFPCAHFPSLPMSYFALGE